MLKFEEKLYLGTAKPDSGGSSSGGDTITATNNTGSAITSGDKVWVNESNGSYSIDNFYKQNYSYNDLSFVGSPTIDNGVVSNFSSSSYIQSPRGLFGVSDYTFYIKFTTGIITSDNESLIEGTCALQRNTSVIRAWNGSSMVDVLSSLQSNKIYWMKVVVSGATRTFYYSTDGINYTQCYTGTFYIREFGISTIGYVSWVTAAFSGNIDLKEMYLKNTSGEIVWSAVSDNTLTGVAKENIANGSTGQVETVLQD